MRWKRIETLSALILICALSACAAAQKPAADPSPAPAPAPAVHAEVLLQTGETILGQPIVYPAGPPTGAPAEVTIAIVTLQPGAATGWHTHPVPLAAHMLDGELTVSYQDFGTRVYRAGDSLVEAIETVHDGRNLGTVPVRILAVFIGAEGVANSLPVE